MYKIRTDKSLYQIDKTKILARSPDSGVVSHIPKYGDASKSPAGYVTLLSEDTPRSKILHVSFDSNFIK